MIRGLASPERVPPARCDFIALSGPWCCISGGHGPGRGVLVQLLAKRATRRNFSGRDALNRAPGWRGFKKPLPKAVTVGWERSGDDKAVGGGQKLLGRTGLSS